MANQTSATWKDRKHRLWWPLSFHKYELRNGRIYQTVGLFSTSIDEVLLYRVTDIQLTRSLSQKLFGTGTITLFIKGDSDRELSLVNIKHPKRVRELLSMEVENARQQNHVVGREFYSGCTHIDGPPPDGPHFD